MTSKYVVSVLSVLAVTCMAGAALASMAGGRQDSDEAAYLKALDDALPGTLMNNPLDPGWKVYGDNATSKVVAEPEITGGYAFQVQVKRAGAQPWDVSVVGSVRDGVAAGDTVLVAFWGRATAAAGGNVQARLQQVVSPYAGIADRAVVLTDDWQLHYLSGVATDAYAPGGLAVSFNVASAKQTVQFGQYYVMNMGQGVDPATLPSGSE